jgi:hypothetical protein
MHARKTGEWRYSFTHSFPWHYVKASGQFNAMAALSPIERPSGTQCIGDSMGCTADLEILLPLLGIKPWFLIHSAHSLVQRCWTYDMQHSLFFQLFYFSCLTTISVLWTICVYILMSDCAETERELLVLANNIASGMSLHKLAVMWTVDCVFITGVHAWWWLGENICWTKC